jgi:pyridoxine 5-phosphate synthase
VRAAEAAIAAGADGIVAHLREDRRHIRDADADALAERFRERLNFEMAATGDMLKIAQRLRPRAACLVPERRQELTTEGGLDAVRMYDRLGPVVDGLRARDIRVSLFIEADERQVNAAELLGAHAVELHTGEWCEAVTDNKDRRADKLFGRLRAAASEASSRGLEVHAGHGLNYETAAAVAALPGVVELNIGHFLVGEALFVGLEAAGLADARGDQRERRRLILGIGSDLSDIRRIERTLERFGERFTRRLFTEVERVRSEAKPDRASSYAKRFAAKEACAKALGTGVPRRGVHWADMGVVNARSGNRPWP